MSSFTNHPYHSYAPSAASLPESHGQDQRPYSSSSSGYYGQQPPVPNHGQVSSSHGQSLFPPGTHPDVIRSFQMVDRDRSGFIDENELQQALSSGYQRFNIRTIRLLMFLFTNPKDSLRIGKPFSTLNFPAKFDRTCSGGEEMVMGLYVVVRLNNFFCLF